GRRLGTRRRRSPGPSPGRGPPDRRDLDPAAEPEHPLPEPDRPRAARLMGLLTRLVTKDLKRKARSPLGFLAALAFPLVFAGMISLAFGRGNTVPKVRMLVDNEDGGLLGNALASAFTSQQAAAYFDGKSVGAAEGRALMEAGKASAFLTIPPHFTQDVLDG